LNFLDIYSKYSRVEFHENASSESRFPCEQTDRQTDMTTLTFAFPNFAKAYKNEIIFIALRR